MTIITFSLSGMADSGRFQKGPGALSALMVLQVEHRFGTTPSRAGHMPRSLPKRYQSASPPCPRQGARSRTRLLSGSARKVAAFVTYVSRRLIPVPKRGSKTFVETQARSAELLVGTVLVPGGERMTITDKSYASAQIRNSGASQGS